MKKLILFLSVFCFLNLLKAERRADMMLAEDFPKVEDSTKVENSTKETEANISDDVNADLLQAIDNNDYERVKLLIEKGADVNFKYVRDGEYQEHPLYRALSNGRYKIAELLIKNGANVDEEYGKKHHERTLLHYALFNDDSKMPNFIKENTLVKFLTDKYKMAKFLLKHKAYVNAGYGPRWQTVLHQAVFNKDIEVVRFLFENKTTNANVRNSSGDTALHYIVSQLNHKNHTKYYEIAKILVKNGANPQLRNNKGISSVRIYNKRNRGLYSSQQGQWYLLLSGRKGHRNPFGKILGGWL